MKFLSRLFGVICIAALSAAALLAQGLPEVKPIDARNPLHIACVGDSLTFGDGIEGRQSNAYPAVLNRLLGERFLVKNFGVNGATLLRKGDHPYWEQPQFKELAAFAPRIIVLMLGSNDTKPQNWAYREVLETDLLALLDQFASFERRAKVFLCLPPPVYEDRWGISAKRIQDELIPMIQRVGKVRGVGVIDLHTAMSGHPELFHDRVHPNAAGAALMAQTVFEAIMNKKPSNP